MEYAAYEAVSERKVEGTGLYGVPGEAGESFAARSGAWSGRGE
jgi:hypothetical protein